MPSLQPSPNRTEKTRQKTPFIPQKPPPPSTDNSRHLCFVLLTELDQEHSRYFRNTHHCSIYTHQYTLAFFINSKQIIRNSTNHNNNHHHRKHGVCVCLFPQQTHVGWMMKWCSLGDGQCSTEHRSVLFVFASATNQTKLVSLLKKLVGGRYGSPPQIPPSICYYTVHTLLHAFSSSSFLSYVLHEPDLTLLYTHETRTQSASARLKLYGSFLASSSLVLGSDDERRRARR